VIRYSLQKLRLVRWLLKKVFQRWRATPATAAGFEDEAKSSARDAALAYHRLHQLHITGEGPVAATKFVTKYPMLSLLSLVCHVFILVEAPFTVF
jgi:hypothetical protein